MKKKIQIFIMLVLSLCLTSCFEDRDDNPISLSEINDFVYQGMNNFYLYRDNVPNLVANKNLNPDYSSYLNSFSSPENLFESLIYNRETVDRFSWITDDYLELEQQFAGVSTTNGMEFGLLRYTSSSDDIFGYVRYILPSTSAESENLERGDLFYAVDGTPLTVSNWRSLMGQDSYTLNLATYNDNGTPETDDDSISPSNENISLTKVPYTENPVFKTEILDVEGSNVGYLMYNGFVANFDNQLNDAFGVFQANNVEYLVIDLRYNPGGSVNSASLLGSMATGQFNGQVFAKLNYNSLQQANNTIFDFKNMINGNAINSLNLDKVYVLATGSSASASEMVINSLQAHIDVIHIGSQTTGKSQASITLYDSPNYGRSGANPNHTYALQPLVAITTNVNDEIVPFDGLIPDVQLSEEINNLGILGDLNEPLLAEALAHIASTNRVRTTMPSQPIKDIGDSKDLKPHAKEMYIDQEQMILD